MAALVSGGRRRGDRSLYVLHLPALNAGSREVPATHLPARAGARRAIRARWTGSPVCGAMGPGSPAALPDEPFESGIPCPRFPGYDASVGVAKRRARAAFLRRDDEYR